MVLRAERYGFDFALSMIKLRGFGGKSRYWDDNLESFTLMAGLASITSRIELYATVAVLTLPPALTARMAMTIDSISHGRFGVNLVTGWQKAEYDQMGLWPGDEHFKHRYELLDEYATVMQELWVKGQSDLKGKYYTMNDCRLGPLPSRPIPMICAGTSDAGMKFAARHCAYNFCSGNGEMNNPRDCADSVARLNACTTEAGTKTKALALTMIIADETDEAAMAKWEHYKAGVDLDALDWSRSQAGADKYAADNSTAGRIRRREPLAQQRLAADRLLRHRGAPARRDVGDRGSGRRHADLRRLRDRRRAVRPAHPALDAQPRQPRCGGVSWTPLPIRTGR